MNFILPIILILSSIGIFFGYVDPNYKGDSFVVENKFETYGIQKLKEEYSNYQNTLNDAVEVKKVKEAIEAKYLNIKTPDIDKLLKLLPDNIDNVKLLIEATDILSKRNLVPKSISIGGEAKTTDKIGPDNTLYGTLSLNFSVNATYENFLGLLEDLEKNLRLIDITNISFSSSESGFYDFSVSLNTYWLK